ncbi:MAG: SH3 domain-containing protein [Anaerolineales bacterium]|nr:SH3 domain-containing protein [Anaerolineales bacterium]
MTTRAQLEEILAAQRARRMISPAPRGRGRGLISALAVIAILTASGAAMFFAVQWTAPKASAATTVSPLASPPASATFTNIPATPITMQVCTDIPEGRLHVRFAAGDGSEVRGYLAEGEAVQVAPGFDGELDSQMIQGNQWLHITSPVAGWVNARYLCKSE